MIIESLKLENFRNISRSELQFDSDAVFFEGGNGQGKTSLLEAVFYVANLRSFRTVKINELKKLGSPSFHLSLLFRKMQGWKSLLEVDCGLVAPGISLPAAPVSLSRLYRFTSFFSLVFSRYLSFPDLPPDHRKDNTSVPTPQAFGVRG